FQLGPMLVRFKAARGLGRVCYKPRPPSAWRRYKGNPSRAAARTPTELVGGADSEGVGDAGRISEAGGRLLARSNRTLEGIAPSLAKPDRSNDDSARTVQRATAASIPARPLDFANGRAGVAGRRGTLNRTAVRIEVHNNGYCSAYGQAYPGFRVWDG